VARACAAGKQKTHKREDIWMHLLLNQSGRCSVLAWATAMHAEGTSVLAGFSFLQRLNYLTCASILSVLLETTDQLILTLCLDEAVANSSFAAPTDRPAFVLSAQGR
jgi:hypothetical protein